MEVSGEAADLVMKEGVQISEEAIKLLARGAKNLAALYDGFEPQDRRQALGQIQDMAQKIGGSIEKAISPQMRNRTVNRNAR